MDLLLVNETNGDLVGNPVSKTTLSGVMVTHEGVNHLLLLLPTCSLQSSKLETISLLAHNVYFGFVLRMVRSP